MATVSNQQGWYREGMRPLITIAGTPILDPWEYNATTSTIVDSARNAQGVMIGSVIRNAVSKVEGTYQYISAEEWAKIQKLFEPEYGGNFVNPVTFYNQIINDWETKDMYISDRTAKIFLRRKDGSIRGYQSARIALIQI